jgi:pyruvate kinase
MIAHATAAARREGVARPGDTVVVIAGIPFGQSGSTNLLHVVKVPDA